MGSTVGQRIGEIIITALWPLIWVIYVLVSVVIFVEAATVYLWWRLKKTGAQTAG